jgi:hypothetical protein
MKNKIMSQSKILLIDSTLNFSDYQSFISYEIITLDYFSHKKLTEKEIIHKTSDDFVNLTDLKDMENQIYDFVNWYSVDEISKIITDDKINLGELFYTEFRAELTQFLKTFLEVSKIFSANSNCSFQVSEKISEMISIFSKNFNIIKSTNQTESIFTTVDVPIKIGTKNLTLKLNSKNISKLKTILDKFTNHFLTKKINDDFQTILLINFTTLKTEEFLLTSRNYNLNVVKYDGILPSIWNKKTFNIIKKSKCIVENKNTLFTNKLTKQLDEKHTLFEKMIESILSNEEILSNYFTINGKSFWEALRPSLIRLCKKNFFNAAQQIVLIKKLFEKHSFTKVLLFNESEMIEQIVISIAKQYKIPVFHIQHGVYFDSQEMISENKFGRIIPQKSDFFITWGQNLKNYLIDNSIDPTRIKNLGCIFFDKLFRENILNDVSNQILLASDPLAFNRPLDLSIDQKELYNNTIEKVCKTIFRHNKKLIIKTHPQKNQFEKEIAKKIDSSIQVFHSGDIHPLIKSSDLVIVTDMSTVILESMIMQKPVISIRMKEHYGKPSIFDYCKQISLDAFDSWIKSFYDDPNIKNDMIAKGNEFLKICLENHGNASAKLFEFLQEN